MGAVSVCVKRSYIVVGSLIALISALLLAFTLFSHGHFHEREEFESMLPGLQLMYAVSLITILLITTGLYGVCKKKKWMLICYVVGMILSCLFLCVFVIQLVTIRPMVAKGMRAQYLSLMPLTQADPDFIQDLVDTEEEFQCCGLDQGYQDWGYNISEGCLCAEDAVNPCVAAPRNSSLFENVTATALDEPIMIYKEPCVPFLIAHVIFTLHCLFGSALGILILWILSVVLCIVILCQLNQKEDTPAVVYSPEAKAGNYSVLSDDAEFT